MNDQAPMSKAASRLLVIGNWTFFGHWSLSLVIFGGHGFWLRHHFLRTAVRRHRLPPGFSVTQDLEQFLFADLAGDVVANGRAHDLSFDRGQTAGPILYES